MALSRGSARVRTPLCGSDRIRVWVSASFQKNARLVGRIGSWPCLVGRLGSGPHLVGQIGSGYGLVPVFQKKCQPRGSDRVTALSRGSARVRTPPCGSDRFRVRVSASLKNNARLVGQIG